MIGKLIPNDGVDEAVAVLDCFRFDERDPFRAVHHVERFAFERNPAWFALPIDLVAPEIDPLVDRSAVNPYLAGAIAAPVVRKIDVAASSLTHVEHLVFPTPVNDG